jgi:hypothetical protein
VTPGNRPRRTRLKVNGSVPLAAPTPLRSQPRLAASSPASFTASVLSNTTVRGSSRGWSAGVAAQLFMVHAPV